MTVSKSYILILIALIPLGLKSQSVADTTSCYLDSFPGKEKVFKKIQINATFNGGRRAFQQYLIEQTHVPVIMATLRDDEKFYTDTARVWFIISKKGSMSELIVNGTAKEAFSNEVARVLKLSACQWIPGNYSGRLVDGWYRFDIYCTLDRRSKNVLFAINYRMYDHAAD